MPPSLPRPTDLTQHKTLVTRLRTEVRHIAERLGLAPELLANRRTVEELVRRSVDGQAQRLPATLQGWRADVVGIELLKALG